MDKHQQSEMDEIVEQGVANGAREVAAEVGLSSEVSSAAEDMTGPGLSHSTLTEAEAKPTGKKAAKFNSLSIKLTKPKAQKKGKQNFDCIRAAAEQAFAPIRKPTRPSRVYTPKHKQPIGAPERPSGSSSEIAVTPCRSVSAIQLEQEVSDDSAWPSPPPVSSDELCRVIGSRPGISAFQMASQISQRTAVTSAQQRTVRLQLSAMLHLQRQLGAELLNIIRASEGRFEALSLSLLALQQRITNYPPPRPFE